MSFEASVKLVETERFQQLKPRGFNPDGSEKLVPVNMGRILLVGDDGEHYVTFVKRKSNFWWAFRDAAPGDGCRIRGNFKRVDGPDEHGPKRTVFTYGKVIS